jgi:hypothetical protein
VTNKPLIATETNRSECMRRHSLGMPAIRNPHPTPHTLHPAPRTLHPAPRNPQPTTHNPQRVYCTSHTDTHLMTLAVRGAYRSLMGKRPRDSSLVLLDVTPSTCKCHSSFLNHTRLCVRACASPKSRLSGFFRRFGSGTPPTCKRYMCVWFRGGGQYMGSA